MTLLDIADGIKAEIATNFGSAATVDVSFDPVVTDPLGLPVGDKYVYVIPMPDGVEFREASDRENDRHVYKVGVLFFERLVGSLKSATEKAALTTKMKANINLVDTNIYSLKEKAFVPVQGTYLESIEWRTVYNVDFLREYGIFWSEIDFEYAFDEPS